MAAGQERLISLAELQTFRMAGAKQRHVKMWRLGAGRSHSGPSSAPHQAPPPPAFFSGSTEAETSGSRRRSGGLFCVFNYVPLTDTLLYITRVKLGNQAAALSQRSGLLPRY